VSIEQALLEQVRFLTPEQQQEVLDFVAYLRQRSPGVSKKKRIPGLHKGNAYWMADDFDVPLPGEDEGLPPPAY
jgi:hypothetical protein